MHTVVTSLRATGNYHWVEGGVLRQAHFQVRRIPGICGFRVSRVQRYPPRAGGTWLCRRQADRAHLSI
jgi:hypothetical protein